MVALRDEHERLTTIEQPARSDPPRPKRVAPPPVRLRAAARSRTSVHPTLPLVRRDMLPENALYADTGCDLFPSCLRCPLARCRYDTTPGGLRRLKTDARDREIAFIRNRHRAPINALAATYGLTRRSIFRILSEQRAAQPPRDPA